MSKTELDPLLKEFQADDLELTRDLLGLRQQPGEALKERISAIPEQQSRRAGPVPGLVWGLAALVIAVLLFTSPVAKATLGELEKVVGQIHLTVIEVLPKNTEAVVIESRPTSFAEVRATVPFDLAMPTYIPGALTAADKQVSVINLDTPLVKVLWRDTKGSFVQLTAHPYNQENNLAQTLIGPDSSETISINGQTAVLVRGGWDESSQTWSYQDQLTTLIWEVNGIQYRLLSFSSAVPLSELIAMAESVR
jgi:hypothetical protein